MARPYIDGETLAEGLKVGIDKEGNKVVLVTKGWKLCSACKRPVKGPRTKVCTHADCGATLIKAEKPTKVKVKASPAPVVEAPKEVVRIPDPYTFVEISTPDFTPPKVVKGSTVRRNTLATLKRNKSFAEVMAYVEGLPNLNPAKQIAPTFIAVA